MEFKIFLKILFTHILQEFKLTKNLFTVEISSNISLIIYYITITKLYKISKNMKIHENTEKKIKNYKKIVKQLNNFHKEK